MRKNWPLKRNGASDNMTWGLWGHIRQMWDVGKIAEMVKIGQCPLILFMQYKRMSYARYLREKGWEVKEKKCLCCRLLHCH